MKDFNQFKNPQYVLIYNAMIGNFKLNPYQHGSLISIIEIISTARDKKNCKVEVIMQFPYHEIWDDIEIAHCQSVCACIHQSVCLTLTSL